MIPASVVIRLEVQHVDPSIWRVVRVPADLRLSDLHHVLQMVMGWRNCHAHAFQIQSCASTIDEGVTIAEALTPPHRAFTYVYDVAGEWRVSIARASGVWRGRTKSDIICLDGYLAGPRDDGGGPAAYSAILAATLGDGPGLTEAQAKWVGPNFDPERFDRCAVNRALATLQPAL